MRHELLVQEEVLNIKFDFNLIEKFTDCLEIEKLMDYMEVNGFSYYPVVRIYYLMLLAYTKAEDDSYYFEMKRLINENSDLFDDYEKFNLYVIMESICLSKLSMGKKNFNANLMSLYEEMLSENNYLASGKDYFQLNLFRNMFYTAVILKKFDWSDKFIETYSSKLHPGHRENMYRFSRAVLNFEKSMYEDALREINRVNQDFFVFKFDAKVIMLKIFYELNLFEQAFSLIDSFSHFLSKNRTVPLLEKERFGNFLKHVKNLIKVKSGALMFDEFSHLRGIDIENIISKRWVLEKAEELKYSAKRH
jgi:hypothetical protein